jgi:hypothetical protein
MPTYCLGWAELSCPDPLPLKLATRRARVSSPVRERVDSFAVAIVSIRTIEFRYLFVMLLLCTRVAAAPYHRHTIVSTPGQGAMVNIALPGSTGQEQAR